jgi:hypothetical protein
MKGAEIAKKLGFELRRLDLNGLFWSETSLTYCFIYLLHKSTHMIRC